jgi:hypothetical protein
MNYEANKTVGKGIKEEAIVNTLQLFKEKCPDVFTQAGFIVGLPNDSKEKISGWLDLISENDFPLDCVSVFPLGIDKNQTEFWPSDFDINYQKYANNIKINYSVNYIPPYDNTTIEDNRIQKGFYAGEVYAFYIVFEMLDGTFSKAYHIPGRKSAGTDKNNSSFAANFDNLSFTPKRFHLEDTCNNSLGETNMGYWENENEIYPNNNDFNSSLTGGEDLRTKQVRHHKFPSLRYLRNNSSYGVNSLPILSINASNVTIPDYLVGKVKSWRICYAKRTVNNSTILGTSVLLSQAEYTNSAQITGEDKKEVLSPMPFHGLSKIGANRRSSRNKFRFHAFDLLVNKPEISPIYLFNEYRLQTVTNRKLTVDEENHISGYYPEPFNLAKKRSLIDRTGLTTTSSLTASNEYIIPVTNHKYVPCNGIVENIDNRLGEEHLHLELKTDLLFIDNTTEVVYDNIIAQNTKNSYDDKTYISTLKQLQSDVYQNFYEQLPIVLTDLRKEVTSNGTFSLSNIKGGDAAPYMYSNIFTGTVTGNDPDKNINSNNPTYVGFGHLSVHYFATYSTGVINRRYQDILNVQTLVYPTIKKPNSSILKDFDPTKGQLLKYSKDYSLLNEVNSITGYNSLLKTVYNYPNRLHPSSKINRTVEYIVFDFNFRDNYELPKNKGLAIGLNSFDNKLVIAFEKTRLITSPKIRLKSISGNEIAIADNNLLDLQPQELLTTENGFIGSSSKFHSFVCEHGLLMIDEVVGKIFLLSKNEGQLIEISKRGLQNFFLNNLKFYNNYTSDYYQNTTSYKNNNNRSYIIDYDNTLWNTFNIGDTIYDNDLNYTGKILDLEIIDGKLNLHTDLITSDLQKIVNINHIRKTDSPSYNGGFIIGYDPDYERFLITKNDKKSLNNSNKSLFKGFYTNNGSNNNVFLLNNVFVKYENGFLIPITNVDNSFTISYCPTQDKQFWGSFHPFSNSTMFINARDKLLGIQNVENPVIYKFNVKTATGLIYNSTITFSIEVIENDESSISKKYYKISWDTKLLDKDSDQLINDKTFETIQLSNSYQSIDEVILDIYENISDRGNVRKIKNTWKYGKVKTSGSTIKDRKYLTDSYLSIIFKDTSNYQLFINFIDTEFNKIENL